MLQPDYSIAWVATGMIAVWLLLAWAVKRLPDWAPDWCWRHRRFYNRQLADFFPWPGHFFTALMVIAAILFWLFPLPKVVY